jgi:hypothetical protein
VGNGKNNYVGGWKKERVGKKKKNFVNENN